MDDAARQDRELNELTSVAMDLAQDLAKRAKAAAADADAAALALAFDRVFRSFRMGIALQQRLVRDRKRAEREDRDAGLARLDRRRQQIKAAIRRTIGEEAGLAEGVRLNLRLTERLEEEALFETFSDGPIEQHIARIRRVLGMEAEPASPSRPGEAAGGGPPAVPGEGPGAVGMSPGRASCDGDAVLATHEPHEREPIPAAGCNSS